MKKKFIPLKKTTTLRPRKRKKGEKEEKTNKNKRGFFALVSYFFITDD